MKVTMIIGAPAVGKSRLARELLDRLAPTTFHRIPYVTWHESVDGTIVIGDYSDTLHKYPGTDKLSMACQPRVIRQLIKWQNWGTKSVIFEGDRLGNDSMIKALQYMGVDLEVIQLICSGLSARRSRERPEQSTKFQASRDTKIENMTGPVGRLARTNHQLRVFPSDFPSDTANCANWILENRR